jgi:hypothetical protein
MALSQGGVMRKTFVLCLLIVPFFLLSEDEEFSYSYLGLSYNDGDSKGATLEGSLWLPAGFYLSGSAERSDYQIKGSEYEKNSESLRLGIHYSIADVFKKASYKKIDFEFAKFLDFYVELGPKRWELVDELGETKASTDLNFVGGLRFGDSEGWEADIFFDRSKQAEIEIDPNTLETKYGLGDDTESIFGLKTIRNYSENIAFVMEASDKSTSGKSYTIGFRYKL